MSYSETMTLLEARSLYFERNHFGPDGGYGARWVIYRIAGLPFPFPNSAARVKAVRYHDLHHIVTDYETDFAGETEIGAWEIGSDCRAFPAAFHLNLCAMGAGALIGPARTFRAFVRGRRSRNLYDQAFDEQLLRERVGDVRRKLELSGAEEPPTFSDVVLFALTATLALVVLFTTFAVAAPIAILAWPWLLVANSQTDAAAQ